MKGVGVVVEYNPFHNGHKYHMEMARELSGCEIIIGVMSGDFLQRGEPGILDKWERARMALLNGVDLVVELPSYYSTQNAEVFGIGSVGILKALQVESIVFGSESSDIEKLKEIAYLEEDDKFKEILGVYLKEGDSYPTAFSKAVKKTGREIELNPNDILGIHYIKALGDSKIKPIPLKRIENTYHSKDLKSKISSATSIRNTVFRGVDIKRLRDQLPDETYKILGEKKTSLKKLEDYYKYIRYEILKSKDAISKIQDVEVGFEHRLYKSAKKYRDFSSFFESIKSKRYTIGRLQRILIHILLGITKEMTEDVKKDLPYIRVLGFNERGSKYIKEIRKKDEIIGRKILTSLKNVKELLSEKEREYLTFDEEVSEIYHLESRGEERSKVGLIVHKRRVL